jgi:hypothetical protein
MAEEKQIATSGNKGISPACQVCNHGACDKATEVYFQKEPRDIDDVIKWFENFFPEKIDKDTWAKHFKEHIDPFVTKAAFLRERKLLELKERCLQTHQDSSTRFNLIKQMLWEFMLDVHASKEENLQTKEGKLMHQKMSKQLVELAKSYRDYYQMELEIIGMGKTEKEQRQEMERFMVGVMQQAVQALSDHPDAQDVLSRFLNLNLGGSSGEEEVIEEED